MHSFISARVGNVQANTEICWTGFYDPYGLYGPNTHRPFCHNLNIRWEFLSLLQSHRVTLSQLKMDSVFLV